MGSREWVAVWALWVTLALSTGLAARIVITHAW
jgi:hypothetical protein